MTNGKGSSPRPFSVDSHTYAANYERTFPTDAQKWKDIAGQYAQVLMILADDPRLDQDTRDAITRTLQHAKAVHGL